MFWQCSSGKPQQFSDFVSFSFASFCCCKNRVIICRNEVTASHPRLCPVYPSFVMPQLGLGEGNIPFHRSTHQHHANPPTLIHSTLLSILFPPGVLAALVAIVTWGSYAGLMKSPALSKARVSPWVFQLYMNFGVFLASGWYATPHILPVNIFPAHCSLCLFPAINADNCQPFARSCAASSTPFSFSRWCAFLTCCSKPDHCCFWFFTSHVLTAIKRSLLAGLIFTPITVIAQ